MIPILEETLFEIIESEADILYYINDAKKPAIIVNGRYSIGHSPYRKSDRYTVWFGNGIARFSFPTLTAARSKAEELLSKPLIPLTVRVVFPRYKRNNYAYSIEPIIGGSEPKPT